ncbi:15384_t:CDS:1, partial [Entrophospora sp. SA101]
TGKSRFLDEAKTLLLGRAVSSDKTIQTAFQDTVAVNITYGNGSAVTDLDIKIWC